MKELSIVDFTRDGKLNIILSQEGSSVDDEIKQTLTVFISNFMGVRLEDMFVI